MVRDGLHHRIQRLSDAVQHDPLTGLLNRRGFDEVLDVELRARTARRHPGLSVVVGDLDGFERVNDEYGNADGDTVLRTTARAIEDVKRGFDSAARIGGEELALIAPDCDEHGAYMLAERTAWRSSAACVERAGADGQLRGVHLPASRAHRKQPPRRRRSGPPGRQAPRRQPLGDLERRGGRHPRAAAAKCDAQVELRGAAVARRGAGQARHRERHAPPARGPLRRAHRAGARLSPDAVERVRLAGILHDVGRVALPDELMRKQGPLTAEEWSLVRSHPEVGARMVETTDYADIRS